MPHRVLSATLVALCMGLSTASCKKEQPAPKQIDLREWTADPSLPKPEITTTVKIIKEPERQKISMQVEAREAHGLTVHEVHFRLKYRIRGENGEYTYPDDLWALKMIPKITQGKGEFKTPIVELHLRDKAWQSTDDNWEAEVMQYNQYYKE